ncbi:MAG: universal stress protein [Candidatus Promineifilaceae bacterium]
MPAELPRLETRLRQGALERELLLEAQEGHYELVVLGGPARADRHLEQGQASLGALGVESKVALSAGPVVEGILRAAEAEDSDLVVIGAPAPRAAQHLFWAEVAPQIAGRLARPLLIVPMAE